MHMAERDSSFYNQHPEHVSRWDTWFRETATKAVTAERAAEGWRPMAEVPKNRYVGLLFRGGTMGDYEGAGAYYLEEDRWHVATSRMVFRADNAIAWKPWRKQSVGAEPEPPKGRRG